MSDTRGGRTRAPVDGGYARKTVSLPQDLVDRIEEHLSESPGLTLSTFMTEAAELRLSPPKKPKRPR